MNANSYLFRRLTTTAMFALTALAVAPNALQAQLAGSLDPAFAPSVTGSVNATTVQPDGRIILSGNFSSVNGQPRIGIDRLLADGTVESASTFNPGTGANSWVTTAAVQTDGKIVLGGPFTALNGQARNHIARLNADGTVEATSTFNPGTGVSGQTFDNYAVNSITVQADGKILLAGQFTSVNGKQRHGIARLLTDGTVESTSTFNPGTGVTGADANVILRGGAGGRENPDRWVFHGREWTASQWDRPAERGWHGGIRLHVQSRHRCGGRPKPIRRLSGSAGGRESLISGYFTSVNGEPPNGFARLLTDGTVETTATFNPPTGSSGIQSIVSQANEKNLLPGRRAFGNAGVSRLLSDGTLESTATFNPNFGSPRLLYPAWRCRRIETSWSAAVSPAWPASP